MQIYVEIERARLTKMLANIKEQSGEIKEAASILQELQVSFCSFGHAARLGNSCNQSFISQQLTSTSQLTSHITHRKILF